MSNVLAAIILSMQYNEPILFYGFIGIVAFAVAITYTYRKDAGLITTFLVFGGLSYIGLLNPYTLIIAVASIVVLVLFFVGPSQIIRKINNIRNWFYLYRLTHKKKE